MITLETSDIHRQKESVLQIPRELPRVDELTLMIDATNTCQLKCTYCHYGNKGCNYMQVDKLLNATSNFITTMSPIKKVTFHFMGGEPLIGWKQIQELTCTAKTMMAEKNIAFSWSMTSNLINLDEEKAELMKKQKAGIHSSVDGPQFIHDVNRPFRSGKGSFVTVDKNISLALQISPNDTARATITPFSSYHLPEITSYLLKKGFKKIGLFPAYNMDWQQPDFEAWEVGIKEAYVLAESQGKKISTVIRDKYYSSKKFSYCGAGRGLWAFDVNGVLYNCHHLTNQLEYAIIDASTATPEMIKNAILTKSFAPRPIEAPEKCLACPVLNYCGGGCWAENITNTGDAFLPENISCTFRQITYRSVKNHLIDPPTLQLVPDPCICEFCEGCINCDDCQGCQSYQPVVCCMITCDGCEDCEGCQGCQGCDNDLTC